MQKIIPITAVVFTLCLLVSSVTAESTGQALYDQKCASCHGKDAKGKTAFSEKAKIPDLRSQEVQSKTDREIFDSIARGSSHKQYPHAYALRGMTQAEVNSLVIFIRNLK